MNEQIVYIFSDDKAWLGGRPDMIPWDEGTLQLAEQLRNWVEEYSRPVCEAVVTDDHDRWADYMNRLWGCLGYHWQQAVDENSKIAAAAVAERLQEGRGYRRGGKLGGDPMRDVVLSVAMTAGDGRAPTVFETDYYGFSRGLAGRLNRRLADNPDEWWNELLDHLAGYTKQPGRLEKFAGRCGLQNWLGTVLWNFLRRWIQHESKLTGSPENDDMDQKLGSTDDTTACDESLQCFVALVRETLDTLPKDDLLLLKMCFLEGLKQKDVATVLGIHSGNVTRRLKKALGQFRDNIEEAAAKRFGDGSYTGILEELTEDPKTFAAGLCDALGENQELEEEEENRS